MSHPSAIGVVSRLEQAARGRQSRRSLLRRSQPVERRRLFGPAASPIDASLKFPAHAEGRGIVDFGIQLATSSHSWKVVKRAEELGFTHAWFYDTQLLNADVFVAMAAAAMQTSRIRLCTGVLIPSNRIAPVAASALASLNALAPGRIHFGVGTGFTARRTMGLRAITTRATG